MSRYHLATAPSTPPHRRPVPSTAAHRDEAHRPLWPDTQPLLADDELAFHAGGFREALDGLQVRELSSPDLFSFFFGARR